MLNAAKIKQEIINTASSIGKLLLQNIDSSHVFQLIIHFRRDWFEAESNGFSILAQKNMNSMENYID